MTSGPAMGMLLIHGGGDLDKDHVLKSRFLALAGGGNAEIVVIPTAQEDGKLPPLMLVLDDLHWADHSSLLLLEFLAREIQSRPLLVLGTYRDVEVSRRHPLSETLGSLIREQPFLRVQLSGLAEPEVEQLIQRAATFSPPLGLSATIHQRTEGNPLFVTEIIRMLPGEGIEEETILPVSPKG